MALLYSVRASKVSASSSSIANERTCMAVMTDAARSAWAWAWAWRGVSCRRISPHWPDRPRAKTAILTVRADGAQLLDHLVGVGDDVLGDLAAARVEALHPPDEEPLHEHHHRQRRHADEEQLPAWAQTRRMFVSLGRRTIW